MPLQISSDSWPESYLSAGVFLLSSLTSSTCGRSASGRRCGRWSGSGFCSQNQRRLHFGLGADGKVDKVVVRWPSGKMSELTGPEINRVHTVKEPV